MLRTFCGIHACRLSYFLIQALYIKVGRFDLSCNGRSLALNSADGFVKLIADAETDEVIGCHIIKSSDIMRTDMCRNFYKIRRLISDSHYYFAIIHEYDKVNA
ncbi:MAG TPA: hypothetical protein DCG37_04105 [Lachnospiraceae bacterium]|nr:hypothetical protein [Lachnospiraceae bacterium]